MNAWVVDRITYDILKNDPYFIAMADKTIIEKLAESVDWVEDPNEEEYVNMDVIIEEE